MRCPKHQDVELEFQHGDYPTGVSSLGYSETRYEEFYYCFKCDIGYDPADLEENQDGTDTV